MLQVRYPSILYWYIASSTYRNQSRDVLSFCFLSGQPPWDMDIGKKFIIHYTYGCDYNLKVMFLSLSSFFSFLSIISYNFYTFSVISWTLTSNFQGELTYGKMGEWRFDKRSHLRGPLPRNLPLPPPGVPESVVCFWKTIPLSSYISIWNLTCLHLHLPKHCFWRDDQFCDVPYWLGRRTKHPL